MSVRNTALSFLVLGLLVPAGLSQSPIDAQHYKLEIELIFTSSSISGKNTATFKSTVAGLKTIDLDLYSVLTVSSVKMGGTAVSFSRPYNKLRITLDRAYNVGQSFTVEIDYGGRPPNISWGGMIFTTHGSARTPMCWTLSEPWAARGWWPCKDELDDKSTADIWITTRSDFISASNGKLMGTDVIAGNKKRYRWKSSYPIIPYLVSIVSTDYRTRTDTYNHMGATMPVEFYVFPESWNYWVSGMNRVVPMLAAFSNSFGQYPFINEKYGIAQFTWGGGMEHQTITSQYNVGEWLTAHELAHMWWGDMVTCKTWHDIWLNEGFATFSEALWYETKPGGSMAAYHSRMNTRKPRYTSSVVYVYNPTSTSAIFNSDAVYKKGGWVVHMLRHVLGDTAFFKALADYRTAYEGGSATTRDLQAVLEKSSGKKLGYFFDQWVFKPGFANYRYAYKHVKIGTQDYLYLQISQAQSTPAVFTMPLDVRVRTSQGTNTHVVWDDERQDQFVIPIQGPPLQVNLDPDKWVLTSGVATTTYATPLFAADAEVIDTVKGGNSGLHIDRGPSASGRPYMIFIGMSGSSPGTQLGSLTVPLNIDALTLVAYGTINSPVFAAFAGKLSTNGMAKASLNVAAGLAISAKGIDLTFAYVLVDTLNVASRPITVHLE